MTDDEVRAMVREVDYRVSDPPEYATLILVSQIKSEKTWLVTAEHGAVGDENRKVNRYRVVEEVVVKPVRSFN